jgi:predicted O-linked N-acetylglucosamine transferase (SPINDLY family)
MQDSTRQELFNTALSHHQAGDWVLARTTYERYLECHPDHPHALANLGSVYRQLGLPDLALRCLLRATMVAPEDAGAHYNLANLYRSQGQLAQAIQAYHQSLSCPASDEQHAQTAYNLGLTQVERRDYEAAETAYRQACSVNPRHVDAALNLATLLAGLGRLTEAGQYYENLLQRHPDDARIINNLASLYQDAGRTREALHLLQQAIDRQPDLPQPRSNRLMSLQYDLSATPEYLLAEAQAWGHWATGRATRQPGITPKRHFRTRPAAAPLRVGYVSADFCMHPVGLFLNATLTAHDPTRVTPILYSNGSPRDGITAQLVQAAQSKGGGFREVRERDDLTLARQIQADEVDVLIDLAGHTGKSRLALFALRPSPVQIAWLGYFATTGLPAIDFILLDSCHAPPGTEAGLTERIIRLPHNRFCYTPVSFAPEVSPSPCRVKGHITFGSFNNTAKLNEAVLTTWAAILHRVPDSHLIIKWRTLADVAYRQSLETFFKARGIDPGRLELRPMSVHRALLEQYADIDIQLDPFPFSGGHTSCESLWMGVPVITLPGTRIVSRQTFSFLAVMGLTELAASSAEDYVGRAVALAFDPVRLQGLRSTLRVRMQSSPLCDVTGFTRHLETALHQAFDTVRRETALARATEGVHLREQGKPVEERLACYREAWRLAPEEAVFGANLASALSGAGQPEEAELVARQATRIQPARFEAWFNLGVALAAQQKETEAAEAYTHAAGLLPETSIQPDTQRVTVWQAAADAWSRGRHALEAARCYQSALKAAGPALTAQRAHLLGALGEMLEAIHHFPEAETAYREALAITPDDPAQITNLGNALRALRRYDEARTCYERVLALRPDLAGAHTNLGTIFQGLGDNESAVACHRKALALDPGLAPVWSNLAAAMTYSLTHHPEAIREALAGFDRNFTRSTEAIPSPDNTRKPDRRLKVGYVSPDFRKHAVAYFALPLIEGHHREAVEVFCYYNHLQQDEWTARFRARADHWRSVVTLSDEALARQIRQDGIDILVDLAGHTEGNRLLTFALKPAPVQVTWMGYVTTTGLSTMDWRVTHADADPPGTESHYSEKLWRLPGTMWCYRPLPDMPAVTASPFERKGYVTFGSFNRYSKNGPAVLAAWVNILERVAGSRLLLCIPEGTVRQEIALFFGARGIDPVRIDCFAKVSHADFWNLHGEVDIALDPFPFGGGTTTCETLWMGVPVVTVTGREGGDFPPRFASRLGQAFLYNLGLHELVAGSVGEYCDIAVRLARDPDRLRALRQGLRRRMAAAPLTDEARFVEEMEQAWRGMWHLVQTTSMPIDGLRWR